MRILDKWRDIDGSTKIVGGTILVATLSIVLLVVWGIYQDDEWNRYVKENDCVQTGKTRVESVPVWNTIMIGGKMGGYTSTQEVEEYEYKCINGVRWH